MDNLMTIKEVASLLFQALQDLLEEAVIEHQNVNDNNAIQR